MERPTGSEYSAVYLSRLDAEHGALAQRDTSEAMWIFPDLYQAPR